MRIPLERPLREEDLAVLYTAFCSAYGIANPKGGGDGLAAVALSMLNDTARLQLRPTLHSQFIVQLADGGCDIFCYNDDLRAPADAARTFEQAARAYLDAAHAPSSPQTSA